MDSPSQANSANVSRETAAGEFYKMDFNAWDEGTSELTLEEEAAYLRLCHQMYRRRQPVPVYDRMLCSLWRCHQNKARPLLKRLIAKGKITVLEDGRVVNGRVALELDARETLRRRRADAGHTGGIRSGETRRKPLKLADPEEAESTRGEERRGEDTSLRKKDDAGASLIEFPAKQKSPEEQAKTDYYARAKKMFNGRGGQIATKLLEAKGGDVWQAMSALGAAAAAGNPDQYCWAIIKRNRPAGGII